MVFLLEPMDPWFLYIHGGFSIYIYVCLQEGSVLKKHCVPSKEGSASNSDEANKFLHATSWFYITGY